MRFITFHDSFLVDSNDGVLSSDRARRDERKIAQLQAPAPCPGSRTKPSAVQGGTRAEPAMCSTLKRRSEVKPARAGTHHNRAVCVAGRVARDVRSA
jgi:hypothetical protein